jgi:hypothetical protein
VYFCSYRAYDMKEQKDARILYTHDALGGDLLYVFRVDVLELQMTVVYPTIGVVVVDIDVLGALMVAVDSNKLKRGLVAAAEHDGMDVVSRVADLLEEADKSRSFFGGVHESDVLSFSCRGCNKLLFTQAAAGLT